MSGAADMMGTPLYMAPEAIADPRSVDGRSDIYAVGAVGYWMLTGTLPFEGGSVLQVLAKALHEPVVPPSLRANTDVPRELEEVIMQCLDKDPDRRPASASVLRERLSAIDGVPLWQESDAGEWWSEHAEVIAARKRACHCAVTGSATVCVARRNQATVAAAPQAMAG